MSNSTTHLDTISSTQSQKEVTANALFNAGSSATLFGRRASTSSGLTWGYYGGRMLVDGALTTINNGTVLLAGSTTNYVESTRGGSVSANTTGFTAGRIPLYTVVTGTASVTSYTDERAWVDPQYILHQASISITTADVTLTAEQARSRYIVLSGTLTGNRNLIVPNSGEWIVYNGTSGAFTVTVKTSAGTGATVDQSTSKLFIADGTNVIALTSAAGSSAFSTIAVSGQSDVVADTGSDTLTLAAGAGITITTNATTDTVTITNSGTASNSFTTIAVSGQTDVVADSATDTLTLAAGSGITLTTNATTDTVTIAASGGGGGGFTLATAQASTSGTSIDFTGIPAGVNVINVMFAGVSTNGADLWLIQLGDSGGVETTGYLSATSQMSTGTGSSSSTAGFILYNNASTIVVHGTISLTRIDGNTWTAYGVLSHSDENRTVTTAGSKTLSAELDRVRITTTGGTQTFDAGTINISYS
jgi:hypothetical protein